MEVKKINSVEIKFVDSEIDDLNKIINKLTEKEKIGFSKFSLEKQELEFLNKIKDSLKS